MGHVGIAAIRILKMSFKKGGARMWTVLIRLGTGSTVNMTLKLWVPFEAENFSTSWATVSF
jgi:hypothetical protein